MVTHPKKYSNKYFYETDICFEYEIGRVLEYFTNKMLSYDIEFEKFFVDENGYNEEKKLRPHYKIFPYSNDIIYMGQHDSFENDVYKICFYPTHSITYEQAKKITLLFCNQDDYKNVNKHGDVENTKDWVEYLTFQTAISEKKEKYENGLIGGRIIVQLKLKKLWAEFRKEKIKNILKNN